MLSAVAEIGMTGVEAAGAWLKAAADMADFERAARALQGLGRNLRQTIALKQRFDREQAGAVVGRRREADAQRQDTERDHTTAVGRHRTQVRRHFQRVLWDEYEANDARAVLEDLDARLSGLADDGEGFLGTPIETLIARLSAEFCDEPAEDGAEDDEPDDDEPEDADEAPVALARIAAPPPEPSPPPEPPPPVEAAVEAEPEPPPPPPGPPPEPDPPPYIPPWEKLRPGQSWPGSSGW